MTAKAFYRAVNPENIGDGSLAYAARAEWADLENSALYTAPYQGSLSNMLSTGARYIKGILDKEPDSILFYETGVRALKSILAAVELDGLKAIKFTRESVPAYFYEMTIQPGRRLIDAKRLMSGTDLKVFGEETGEALLRIEDILAPDAAAYPLRCYEDTNKALEGLAKLSTSNREDEDFLDAVLELEYERKCSVTPASHTDVKDDNLLVEYDNSGLSAVADFNLICRMTPDSNVHHTIVNGGIPEIAVDGIVKAYQKKYPKDVTLERLQLTEIAWQLKNENLLKAREALRDFHGMPSIRARRIKGASFPNP